MRPLMQQVSRSILEHVTPIGPLSTCKRSLAAPLQPAPRPPPCVHGPVRAFSLVREGSRALKGPKKPLVVPSSRLFSASSLRSRDDPRPTEPEERIKVVLERSGPQRQSPASTSSDPHVPDAQSGTPAPPAPEAPPAPPPPDSIKLAAPGVATVPDDQLPSHHESQRWRASKKFSTFMDDLQSKLALASQRLNNYTGTDYSGIAALRREIKEQEALVKTLHARVNDAKTAYEAALAQQASSQKEVVGLLERKHSWAAADLERYMSLIRSEHVNERAVQAAKDALSEAEQALEEARTRLERRERAQYHEEQIWSDTIRRNSTWVTFGLMGFNIFLLLASLVLVEPWRRRRLVREIRGALDEKSGRAAGAGMAGERLATASSEAPAEREGAPESVAQADIEAAIDAVVEPANTSLESIEQATPASTDATPAEVVAAEAATFEPAVPLTASSEPAQEAQADVHVSHEPKRLDNWKALWEKLRSYVRDLFSEQRIAVRKVDVTTAALEGAAAGAAFMGILFVLLRPR